MSKFCVSLLLIALCASLVAADDVLIGSVDDCGEPGLAGGYSPVSMDSALILAEVYELAADEFVAQAAAMNSTEAVPCPDDYLVVPLSACSQVVAGTNYRVKFQVTCASDDVDVYTSDVVTATVFVPLPSADDALPQVVDIET